MSADMRGSLEARLRVLEETLFSSEQRAVLKDAPVWELEPPQREEYNSDLVYMLALRRYADAVITHRAKRAAPEKAMKL